MRVPVGVNLPPCPSTLGVLDPVLHDGIDFLEITPETTWRHHDHTALAPGAPFPGNDHADVFARLLESTGAFAVAHGVGLSLGSARPSPARREAWLRSVARDHGRFGFRWFTDHLGVTELDGTEVTLPLALPWNDESAAAVVRSLRDMATVVDRVGFETTAFTFVDGTADEEAAWIRDVLATTGGWLLLDLFNVYANAVNHGFDPDRYVDGLPLDRVIEVHVAGGTRSSPDWLPSGKTMLLDGHDAPVPEEVWRLLSRTLPRCPALRGVLLERVEGTVDEQNVDAVADELVRLRREVALA